MEGPLLTPHTWSRAGAPCFPAGQSLTQRVLVTDSSRLLLLRLPFALWLTLSGHTLLFPLLRLPAGVRTTELGTRPPADPDAQQKASTVACPTSPLFLYFHSTPVSLAHETSDL